MRHRLLLLPLALAILLAIVIVFLGMTVTGLGFGIIGLVAVIVGAGFGVALWILLPAWPEIGRAWYSWVAIVVISGASALWAQSAPDPGCPGAHSEARVLTAIALAAIGMGALSLPALQVKSSLEKGVRFLWPGIGLLMLSLVWLLLLSYLLVRRVAHHIRLRRLGASGISLRTDPSDDRVEYESS